MTDLFFLVIGAVVIVVTIVLIIIDGKKNEDILSIINERESQLKDTIEDGQSIIEDVNQLYAFLTDEFERKTNELDYLSSDIDKKTREIRDKMYEYEDSLKEKLRRFESSVDEKFSEFTTKVNEASLYRRDQNETKVSSAYINDSPIIKLHKEGYSPVEIAKKLNKGIGEVNLTINLFAEGK